MIFALVFSILNIQTLEEYALEYSRIQAECDAITPEGYICLVDYFPQPPYPLFIIGIIVVSIVSYVLILKEGKREDDLNG